VTASFVTTSIEVDGVEPLTRRGRGGTVAVMDFGGPEMIIVLVIVLVLFGGSQIPKLARNLGKAQKEFKDGIEEGSKSTSSVTDASAAESAPPIGDDAIR
jgi:sec-independent protein translocase protein TatA